MIRVKNLHNAAIRAFNGDFKPVEKGEARNNAIMCQLFNDTMTGKINGFYLVSDKSFRAYHRSPKAPATIQLSIGFYLDGEVIPTSDRQFRTADEAIKDGFTSGIYEIIR